MIRLFKFIFLFTFFVSYSQKEQSIDTIGVDNYNATYILKDNAILKETSGKIRTYQNFNFGFISTVDILNPYEVVLFYDEFNTVVILDNELNLIQTIRFENNISFSKKGITNNIWIYNADENKVQLYDYKSKKTSISSQVLTDFIPTKMESDFNSVRLINLKKTLIFNQYLYLEDTIIH
jgi:hypothetical protein